MHKVEGAELVAESTSVIELVRNYNSVLGPLVAEHDVALAGLGNWVVSFQESGLGLAKFLSQHEQKVQDTLSDSTKKIKAVITIVPGVLDSLSDVSSSDRRVVREASIYTSIASARRIVDRKGSSKPVIAAMQTALDKATYESARSCAAHGYASTATSIIKQHASNRTASGAMRAALDREIYHSAENCASSGYLSVATSIIKNNASSQTAKAAMRGALDYQVLRGTQNILRGGYRSTATSTLKHNASSRKAQAILLESLYGKDDRRQPTSTSGSTKSIEDDLADLRAQMMAEYERMLNELLAGLGGNPQAETNHQPSPGEQIYASLLQGIDAKYVKGIKSYPKHEVVKVIDTIRAAREKAKQEKSTITDREIAKRYINRVQHVPETVTANPDHVLSSQIVLTLLRGSLKNSFPF